MVVLSPWPGYTCVFSGSTKRFSLMERKGIVKYGQYVAKKSAGGNIKVLLKRQIVKFTCIAILTGVVRTSVVFWMPTYISQHPLPL